MYIINIYSKNNILHSLLIGGKLYMYAKNVKYLFLCVYLIMIFLNVTVGIRNAFWVLMGMVFVQTILYAIAEKLDKNKKQ